MQDTDAPSALQNAIRGPKCTERTIAGDTTLPGHRLRYCAENHLSFILSNKQNETNLPGTFIGRAGRPGQNRPLSVQDGPHPAGKRSAGHSGMPGHRKAENDIRPDENPPVPLKFPLMERGGMQRTWNPGGASPVPWGRGPPIIQGETVRVLSCIFRIMDQRYR